MNKEETFNNSVTYHTKIQDPQQLANLWGHFQESVKPHLESLDEDNFHITVRNWLLYVTRYGSDHERTNREVQQRLNLVLAPPCEMPDNVVKIKFG